MTETSLSDPRDNPNLVSDDVAPCFTGLMKVKVDLYDHRSIKLVFDPPREMYFHGWETTDALLKPIFAIFFPIVNDTDLLSMPLSFGIVDGSCLFII